MYVVSRFPSHSAKRTRYTETTDYLPLHSRYHIALPIVSLPSYLPSLVLSKLASNPMLDALATRRLLASPTVFRLTLPEKRSFSNFGTCTFGAFPIIYTSTFSPDHPPHADFDVMCDSAPELRLAVLSSSSGYTKPPFSIASPVCSSTYLPDRSCLYAYRALYTDRPTYLIPIRAPELQA